MRVGIRVGEVGVGVSVGVTDGAVVELGVGVCAEDGEAVVGFVGDGGTDAEPGASVFAGVWLTI